MIILRKFFTRIAFSLLISILLFAATGLNRWQTDNHLPRF